LEEKASLRKKHKARKALIEAGLPLPPELEDLPPL
jgi:biotin carboxylase